MKSKLPIIILIIVLSVFYYLFGTDYMNQRKEQEVLTSQMAEVTQTLSEMPEPPQNLEQRLEAAQASLAVEQSAFPSQINTTRVIDTILRLADDCEVKAIPLVTQPWSIEDVGEHDYNVFRLNVVVEGSFSQLVTFVSRLENGEFKTLFVENISLARVSQQPQEDVAEGIIYIMASLDLTIYTQSLTSD